MVVTVQSSNITLITYTDSDRTSQETYCDSIAKSIPFEIMAVYSETRVKHIQYTNYVVKIRSLFNVKNLAVHNHCGLESKKYSLKNG
jgi:hypothetical protein